MSAASHRHRILPDSIDESKLVLVNGFCCCNQSLLCDDSAIGVAVKYGIMCLELECCLKCSAKPLECGCCAIRAVPVTTCLKGQGQVCCLVNSCAFPPDDEVPCTLAVAFCVCCPQCGCCQTLGNLTREEQTVMVQRQVMVR